MQVISDDGRVLLEDQSESALLPIFPRLTEITPADVVGPYEADSYISSSELLRLRDERLAQGEEVAKEDRARFPIPLSNLVARCCIDVSIGPNETEEAWQAAWDAVYERIMKESAAELAVRRDLRDKRVGVTIG